MVIDSHCGIHSGVVVGVRNCYGQSVMVIDSQELFSQICYRQSVIGVDSQELL